MKLLNLFEGRKDQFMAMMPQAFLVNPVSFKKWQNEVDWALNNLKKQDRIVWYLKIAKGNILAFQLAHGEHSPPELEILANKELGKLNLFFPSTINFVRINLSILKTNFEHYLSLNLPAINNIVWNKQSPDELTNEMREIESDWKQKQKQLIKHSDISEDTKVLLQFPDGKQWVDLNTTSCSLEAQAMGHCGNAASRDSNETIFSLREPAVGGWRPLLTFIYNRKSYSLGEMKGRGNEKPAARYHPYILKLLEQDYIDQIYGGGYKPGNNFKISDLSPSEQDYILDLKPQFMDWYTLYKRKGWSLEVKEKMKNEDVFYFTPETEVIRDEIILKVYDNLADLIESNKNQLKDAFYYFPYINGDKFFEHDYSEDLKDFYDNIPEPIQNNIKAYVMKTYPDEVKEKFEENGPLEDGESYELDDKEVLEILKETSDEIYDAMRNANATAYESGASDELYDAFKDTFEKQILDGGKDIEIKMLDPTQWMDSKIVVTMPVDKFVEMVHEAENDGHTPVDYDTLNEVYQFDEELKDISVPYYGFSGYNEEVGLERFKDDVSEEIWPRGFPVPSKHKPNISVTTRA